MGTKWYAYIGYAQWKTHNNLAYAARVSWPRVKFKTSTAELSKTATDGLPDTTRAIKVTTTMAMKVFLGLPPLHLQLEAETKAEFYRLDCNNQWKPKSEGFGHASKT
jgi:hypothetical protein